MARDLTPRAAMEAYDRLVAARRTVLPEEREEMERESRREFQRAKIIRRLERVA